MQAMLRFFSMAFLTWIAILSLPQSSLAASLNEDIADLKSQVADLNSELFKLEEDILHPANTQIALYLSFTAKDFFVLDSIEMQIDGRMAVSHLYTEPEREALKQGGIQRIYVGNLSNGTHQLTATMNGQGVNSHYFRKEASFDIQKGNDSAQVELILVAEPPAREPSFKLKIWK